MFFRNLVELVCRSHSDLSSWPVSVCHYFLYDLLTGNQTEISGKWPEAVSNEASTMSPSKDSAQAKPDRRIEVTISLSAVRQLLIVR
jgi:hypothetical protein